ncbi:MAG: hypothetical protein JKP95_00680 [Oceanicaulis sp.]|nr:hypothetical protein [Oceanicaulis sp.]
MLNFVGITDIRVIDGSRWDFREETDREAIRALARTADIQPAQAAE